MADTNQEAPDKKEESVIEFFDPHFHIWDVENKVQDPDIFKSVCGGVWYWKDQVEKLGKVDNVVLKGGVFLECISEDNEMIRECIWARKNLPEEVFLAPCVNLSLHADYVDCCLHTMTKECAGVQSIRHILNFEPSWPKTTENFVKNEAWKKNYRILQKYKLAFDCQANPHQLSDLCDFFNRHKSTKVILNHMGTLKDPNNAEELKLWRKGMKKMSRSRHIYVKISMLPYTDKEKWDERDGVVHGLVKEVLKMFTPKRCMFASNYPVDLASDVSPERLIKAFKMFAEGYSKEEQDMLWHGTAKVAYNIAEASAAKLKA